MRTTDTPASREHAGPSPNLTKKIVPKRGNTDAEVERKKSFDAKILAA